MTVFDSEEDETISIDEMGNSSDGNDDYVKAVWGMHAIQKLVRHSLDRHERSNELIERIRHLALT